MDDYCWLFCRFSELFFIIFYIFILMVFVINKNEQNKKKSRKIKKKIKIKFTLSRISYAFFLSVSRLLTTFGDFYYWLNACR